MGVLIGFCSFILSTAVGLAVIFITDQPFLSDIRALKLVETTAYSREVIIENYKAVINYLSPFYRGEFSLPGMSFSESGAGHFSDCKLIFNSFFAAGLVCLIIILCFMLLYKRKNRKQLLVAGFSSLVIPAVILAGSAVSFEKSFVLFHKLFFANSDWQFDPGKDEIINILPEKFFLHCVIFIACFWILAAALLFLLSYRYHKNAGEKE